MSIIHTQAHTHKRRIWTNKPLRPLYPARIGYFRHGIAHLLKSVNTGWFSESNGAAIKKHYRNQPNAIYRNSSYISLYWSGCVSVSVLVCYHCIAVERKQTTEWRWIKAVREKIHLQPRERERWENGVRFPLRIAIGPFVSQHHQRVEKEMVEFITFRT